METFLSKKVSFLTVECIYLFLVGRIVDLDLHFKIWIQIWIQLQVNVGSLKCKVLKLLFYIIIIMNYYHFDKFLEGLDLYL